MRMAYPSSRYLNRDSLGPRNGLNLHPTAYMIDETYAYFECTYAPTNIYSVKLDSLVYPLSLGHRKIPLESGYVRRMITFGTCSIGVTHPKHCPCRPSSSEVHGNLFLNNQGAGYCARRLQISTENAGVSHQRE